MNTRKYILRGLLALCATCVLLAAGRARPTQTTTGGPTPAPETGPKIKDADEAKAEANGKTSAAAVSVRYIVDDVDAAVEFYTKLLGFRVEQQPAPGFASLSRGGLQLLLNAPGAGGAGQSMPDGRKPAPGGWNRIRLEFTDLAKEVETLRKAKARFRNEIVVGNGGKQILLEDPAGNPIELYEPNRR
jgi:catechol 2,3-dioxygenase-like lactoylglutathione lyase family enzyme